MSRSLRSDIDHRLSLIVEQVASHGVPWLEGHSTRSALQALAQEDYKTLLPRVRIFRPIYERLRTHDING